MQNLGNRKQFSHLSIRVSTDLRKDLEKDARRKGIPVNALVNRLLERHIAFDRMTDFDHSIVLERGCFAKIVEKMKGEDLVQIARSLGPKTVKRDF